MADDYSPAGGKKKDKGSSIKSSTKASNRTPTRTTPFKSFDTSKAPSLSDIF